MVFARVANTLGILPKGFSTPLKVDHDEWGSRLTHLCKFLSITA